MAFTDRYIQLPIQVYNKKEKELTGNTHSEKSWMKINPLDIASYRPCYDDDDIDNDSEVVLITTKLGDSTMIFLSMEEFEKRLNAFTN